MNVEDARALGAFEPDHSLWDAWRPEQAATLLEGLKAPWYVAAGWAIELFLGEERRAHERTDDGIPFARPEIVLLFKAKHSARSRDEDDLTAVLPRLGPARRSWLVDALLLVHSGHPWLERI